ncbi:restriction endonuclease subunit S [Campylobacter hyointestinalis]|uniref:restriction endonuclease subunit S n=1 Tax=Campylobacter hyointestinalis TaxID=198 RepID=UPI000DCB2787|nr:restriction endonuclease subunit S [Campylobacter hyointestinalis]RAZ61114.1 restriction endonuclease subunit S [Campylobacter hyointestinalis subsp. lawsonii]
MSKLEELINKLCPNGVEFKTLGELGKFYGGLTGKSKEDFNKGNAKFITYKNVYENLSLKIDVEDRVNVEENEKQRTLEYGDIIFTGSSETSDECGISSVLTQKTEEKLYLNSFCFFLRLNDKNLLNPDFTKHLFRSSNLRYQIGKTASGVTRFNVSKKAMERVCIPVPPLEVQCEIVRILDNFTLLSAELSARQKQYDYYKNLLLEPKVNYKNVKMNDICDTITKQTGFDYSATIKPSLVQVKSADTLSFIQNKDFNGKMFNYNTDYYIPKEIAQKFPKITLNSPAILFSISGKIGNVGLFMGGKEAFIGGAICICKLKKDIEILPEYIMYYAQSKYGQKYLFKNIKASSHLNITVESIRKLEIFYPDIDEQERIANLIENFDKLCNDLSEGLPAEIEARKKQYEYYRDKLLTFKELKAN